MPKQKAKAAAKSDEADTRSAAVPKDTFSAASGKHFAIAQSDYPEREELAAELADDIISAADGDLIEVLLIDGDFAYGRRFRSRAAPAINEGVFHLDWVHGVKVSMEDGKRRPVEVDIRSPDFGLQAPKCTDTATKLRAKRQRKKLDDAMKKWHELNEREPATTAKQEADAQKVAAQLEKEDAAERKRKQKAAARREKRKGKREEPSGPCNASAELQELEPEEDEEAGDAGSAEEASTTAAGASPEERPPESCREERPLESCREERPPESCREGRVQMSWDAQWEQEALQLESVLSASSSGVEDADGECNPRRQKHLTTRKFKRNLLDAKRSGELDAIAEEWERAHTELASKASDLSALNEKVKRSEGDFAPIAEEMASEAEQKAKEIKELKERVFKAMFAMKRSRDLEKTTSDMDDAQKELEMKAIQLRSMMGAWKGMLEPKRPKELERIADEMAEQLHTKAESIKNKLRNGLLRAHRAGELIEIRDELGEIADSVGAPLHRSAPLPKKRWADASSDSDSSFDPKEVLARRCQSPTGTRRRSPSRAAESGAQGEADVSCSDGESSTGVLSPGKW